MFCAAYTSQSLQIFFNFKIEGTFSIQIVEKRVTNSKRCFSLSTKERWTLSWSFHLWIWISWEAQAQLSDPPCPYILMLVYFYMLFCKLVSFSLWFIPASVCVWIFQGRLTQKQVELKRLLPPVCESEHLPSICKTFCHWLGAIFQSRKSRQTSSSTLKLNG